MGAKQPNGTKPKGTGTEEIVRTTETSTDASAIGCWYFLVISKATAGYKHKTTSPETQALLQLYFALQARSSEGAENY